MGIVFLGLGIAFLMIPTKKPVMLLVAAANILVGIIKLVRGLGSRSS